MVLVNKRMTALTVKNQKRVGLHCDGRGLYLKVSAHSKSWIFRWRDRVTGKLRDKGLGPLVDVTLEEARESAATCRRQVRAGGDPIGDARDQIQIARLERAKRLSFGECATQYISAHKAGWRNPKHVGQWTNTLATHAALLTDIVVADVDTALIVKTLEPIWADKTETATRVRQRIEAVLDWARVRGFRTGENPARWRGHLDKLFAKPEKLKNIQHRAALPYAEIGAFVTGLRGNVGIGARALELQILTACRPGEVAGATWAEIDMDGAVWTIPGERMKAGREHRVPLTPNAVALLEALPRRSAFVFAGAGRNATVDTASMLKAARAVRAGIDSHGFRSTFRDWAAESTSHAPDVVEMALAHAIKNKTEAAYRRGDLFDKRRRLMGDWDARCAAADIKIDNMNGPAYISGALQLRIEQHSIKLAKQPAPKRTHRTQK